MKSYFTFLGRNKLYTAIQFFGLAIALGVVILLTSYADTEFNIGNNQSYSHQLYAVGYGDGIGMTTGTAPELFPSIPEIKEWTRLIHIEAADFMVDNQYYQLYAHRMRPQQSTDRNRRGHPLRAIRPQSIRE